MDRDSDSFTTFAPFNTAFLGGYASYTCPFLTIVALYPLNLVVSPTKGSFKTMWEYGVAEGYRRLGRA